MIGQDELFTDLPNKNVSNLHTSFQAYSLLNLYKKNNYFLNKKQIKRFRLASQTMPMSTS